MKNVAGRVKKTDSFGFTKRFQLRKSNFFADEKCYLVSKKDRYIRIHQTFVISVGTTCSLMKNVARRVKKTDAFGFTEHLSAP
jgi:hypothetical protein